MGIYKKEQAVANTMDRLQQSELSKHNKELLADFKELLAARVSLHRVNQVMHAYTTLAPHIDFPLDDPDKDRIRSILQRINRDNVADRAYSPHTRKEMKKALRSFYERYAPEAKPELIDAMDAYVAEKNQVRTDPAELPDMRTVHAMQKACTTPRDKALVAVLWDAGTRISETLHLKWKDVVIADEDVTRIKVRVSKTKPRTIPLVLATDDLERLKEAHSNPHREAYVFTKQGSTDQLSYGAVYSSMCRARERNPVRQQCSDCGHFLEGKDAVHRIPETIKTNPHAFRKGRATDMARRGMNVFMMMEYFGWKKPETAKEYVRLASTDLTQTVVDLHSQYDRNQHRQFDLPQGGNSV